jgi:hypothetical protein
MNRHRAAETEGQYNILEWRSIKTRRRRRKLRDRSFSINSHALISYTSAEILPNYYGNQTNCDHVCVAEA